MKRVMYLFILLLVGVVLVGCQKESSTSNKIVVGMECDYEPFNYTETAQTETNVPIENVPGGYADGYDVRMAKLVAQALGKELVVRAYQWEGLIPALKAGEIDMIIAGMSDTAERRESIDFTDPYYVSEEVILLSNTSSYANSTKLSDFSGARVIAQLGTIYADLVPQLTAIGAVHGTDLDSVPQIVNAILRGQADITIVELPVAKGIVAQNNALSYVRLNPGFEVEESDVAVSIGIRKNYELKAQINEALSKISTDQRTEIMDSVINR